MCIDKPTATAVNTASSGEAHNSSSPTRQGKTDLRNFRGKAQILPKFNIQQRDSIIENLVKLLRPEPDAEELLRFVLEVKATELPSAEFTAFVERMLKNWQTQAGCFKKAKA